MTLQRTPSIVTLTMSSRLAPRLVPTMLTNVPPLVGPALGSNYIIIIVGIKHIHVIVYAMLSYIGSHFQLCGLYWTYGSTSCGIKG